MKVVVLGDSSAQAAFPKETAAKEEKEVFPSCSTTERFHILKVKFLHVDMMTHDTA